MIYRRMTAKDIPAMIALGAEMHAEGAFAGLEYCTDKCRRFGERYINNPQTHFGFCAYDADELVGMIMGDISLYYFGNDKIASDKLWYVQKERRGTITGIRLLNAFCAWAKEAGANEICIGVSTALDIDRTHKLLSRMGFTHVGGTFKAAP